MRIPSPVELDEESATPEGLLSFIVSFYHDIYWDKLHGGDRIQQMFLKELGRLEVFVDQREFFDSQEVLQALDNAISHNDTKLHYNIYKILNPSGKSTVTLTWFKTVAKLGNG